MAYTEIRTTLSKKDCNCADCKDPIKKGKDCIVDPKTKKAYCLNCGKSKK